MTAFDPVIASEESPAARGPRTLTVLALLVATALVFSYLMAYAMTDTLVSAGVLSPWTGGADPRPHRLLYWFACLLGVFLLGCGVTRFLGWRQLRRIDAMQDA